MGTIHPDKVFANNGCRAGDVLILTKPLGVGIVCTANRIQEVSEEAMAQAIRSMTTLNKYASEVVRKYQVHGCTDVTGFGFLGHLLEMLGDAYSARVESSQVPYIPEAFDYAGEFYLTAAAQRNRNHVGEDVQFFEVPFEMEEILFDPQTSGGLLVSIEKSDAEQCLEELKALGLPCAIVEKSQKKREKIEVRIEVAEKHEKIYGRCKRKTVSDSGSGDEKMLAQMAESDIVETTGGQCHCRAESGEMANKNSWNVPGNNRMNIHIGFYKGRRRCG